MNTLCNRKKLSHSHCILRNAAAGSRFARALPLCRGAGHGIRAAVFLMLSILLFSCETFSVVGKRETHLIELHIRDVFREDVIKSAKPGCNPSIIFSVLEEMFGAAGIRFFMTYSDDIAIQELMKEIAIIEAGEKASFFVIKKFEETSLSNKSNIEAAQKMLILSFVVKQLLIDSVKNLPFLIEQVEDLIEEIRWDMENQDEEFDLFFDIIELENRLSYLSRIRRPLLRNTAEISTKIEKIENNLKHFND
ncbi:MAG: hypothetical protein FWC36_01055 [Spirochaetes bacterium]|nr:hypothetical protein [Spirochaetota bacterium]